MNPQNNLLSKKRSPIDKYNDSLHDDKSDEEQGAIKDGRSQKSNKYYNNRSTYKHSPQREKEKSYFSDELRYKQRNNFNNQRDIRNRREFNSSRSERSDEYDRRNSYDRNERKESSRKHYNNYSDHRDNDNYKYQDRDRRSENRERYFGDEGKKDYHQNNRRPNSLTHINARDQEDKLAGRKKNFNFLIVLPKNYFRFVDDEWDKIYKDVKTNVHELKVFNHNFQLKNFKDALLKIDGPSVSCKANALEIFVQYIFSFQKSIYKTLSYVKVSILVPNHITGFIIGIDGKNINKIREMSGAKVDIFPDEPGNRFRQIELSGKHKEIAMAAEKIYRIVNKYYFFNLEELNLRRNSTNQNNGRKRLGLISVKRKTDLKEIQDAKRRRSEREVNRGSYDKSDRRRNDSSSEKEDRSIGTKKDNKRKKSQSTSQERSPSRKSEKKSNDEEKVDNISYNTDNILKTLVDKSKPGKTEVAEIKQIKRNSLNDSLKAAADNKNQGVKSKIKFDFIIPYNFLICYSNEFWEELGKKYLCSIDFRTEKIVSKSTYIHIVTITGITDNISQLILFLQNDMICIENEKK